jgi:hypothetical protein
MRRKYAFLAMVACGLPLLAAEEVTFSKDVAPIFIHSCDNCHRPGSIAPMSLMTYKDARPWARSIKEKVVRRVMPPWHIDRNVGITKFKDDPSLTDAQIALVSAWVDHGRKSRGSACHAALHRCRPVAL